MPFRVNARLSLDGREVTKQGPCVSMFHNTEILSRLLHSDFKIFFSRSMPACLKDERGSWKFSLFDASPTNPAAGLPQAGRRNSNKPYRHGVQGKDSPIEAVGRTTISMMERRKDGRVDNDPLRRNGGF